MTIGDSFFSFIKPSAAPAARPAARPAPRPAAAPPPPPKQNDALTARITELELKIKNIEGKNSSAAPAEPSRAAGTQSGTADPGKAAETASSLKFAQETAELRARIAVLEETICRPGSSDPGPAPLSSDLLDERLKVLESALTADIKERFSVLDASFTETARKAGAAQQASSGTARRVEKLEESAARMEYIKRRLESVEGKLEKIHDMDALVEALKTEVDRMGKNVGEALRDSALMSAEHKKLFSDFESLSGQVRHLSALFNQMRTELAFLMPKKQEGR